MAFQLHSRLLKFAHRGTECLSIWIMCKRTVQRLSYLSDLGSFKPNSIVNIMYECRVNVRDAISNKGTSSTAIYSEYFLLCILFSLINPTLDHQSSYNFVGVAQINIELCKRSCNVQRIVYWSINGCVLPPIFLSKLPANQIWEIWVNLPTPKRNTLSFPINFWDNSVGKFRRFKTRKRKSYGWWVLIFEISQTWRQP